MSERSVRQRLLRDPLDPPPGWIGCPPMGDVVGGFIVPMKTPLDGKFRTQGECWTPRDVMEQFEARGLWLGLVVDLNNSTRYYKPFEFTNHGIQYVKVACKGRGESPDPKAVNEAVFHLATYTLSELPPDFPPHLRRVAAIHCTHGFNRSGYITVCAMVRLMVKNGMTALRGLRAFATARPPGIYKADYITDLFTYHHEQDRRKEWPTPPLPEWKEDDGDDGDEPLPGPPEPVQPEGKAPQHDDVIGEEVPAEEEDKLRWMLYAELHLPPGAGAREDAEWRRRFPGSQPVSLERRNMHLLSERRYYATWKADGTRYMLLINHMGTYLINRNWSFRRVQMRFPTRLQHKDRRRPPPYPVGEPHLLALLDGEMVVDHVRADDGTDSWSRRFLAYDLMLVNGRNLMGEPFKARYELIETEVVAPRSLERQQIYENRSNPRAHPHIFKYRYEAELFSVRRKEFWPLYRARTLIEKFIPALCHEADGLIFQGYEDPYVVGTCHELLKYKFPHLNSVDFQLRLRGGKPQLLLMDRRSGPKGGGVLPLRELPDARIRFPPDVDMEQYDNRIVECTWDFDAREWLFLRERVDKGTPNAWRVYQAVWQSIQDNITDQELLGFLDRCVHMPPYRSDLLKAVKDNRPLPPLPDDLEPYPGHPDYTGPPLPLPPPHPYHGDPHLRAPGPPGPAGLYPTHEGFVPPPDGSYHHHHHHHHQPYPPGPGLPPHHHQAYGHPPHHHHPPMDAPYPARTSHPHDYGHQRLPLPPDPHLAGAPPDNLSGSNGAHRPQVFSARRYQPKAFRPFMPESPPYFPDGPFLYLPQSEGAPSPTSSPPAAAPEPLQAAADSDGDPQQPDAAEPEPRGAASPAGLSAVPLMPLDGLDSSLNPSYADAIPSP